MSRSPLKRWAASPRRGGAFRPLRDELQGLVEQCRREVPADPLPPELAEKLRRILPRPGAAGILVCSVNGWLDGARPLYRWRDAPRAVQDPLRRAVESRDR